MPEHLIYLIRPNNTALWLPSDTARRIKAKKGQRLTREQYDNPEVQSLINDRSIKRT